MEIARKVVSLSRGGCRSAMSASGPSRHFAATRQFGGFQIKADIQRHANYRTGFMGRSPRLDRDRPITDNLFGLTSPRRESLSIWGFRSVYRKPKSGHSGDEAQQE